ncbi:hypothetical protein ABB37_01466 [Leptomonas pyrrhocoris]|uniref:PIN domain-containing protein n=1 Tax=Leptomonas pyrrhocoris TaxID=157538 RepID=A0A0N0DZ97_LEPPY|nr:hypothetical protein ABB37_01466 [Leptomonas pyrrhocoris]KPA85045.1 hypothetical protein ABB37_01466 [Leptomonas pyrrhocoris]|eukprot:XP_015663484.1 hypothetical protein ABB37_01466 [Leptomonas pyrrhocoris]
MFATAPVMRGASQPLSPLLLAASRAQSWADVLRAYSQCRTYLHGSYQPTTAELQYGLAQMDNAWALSLFYHDIVKSAAPSATPDSSLVVTLLRRYKKLNFMKGLKRVIEEDVDSATLDGAKAKITLASYTGMWEVALATLLSQPKLKHNPPLRRSVLATLSVNNQWRLALQVLRMPPAMELRPAVVRPLVRCFGRLRQSDMALRLTAASLAAGYTFDAALLSALLVTLQDTNQWRAALEAAQSMQLFSATRAEGRKNCLLFNQLVNCLYDADLYSDYTVDEVVQDVLSRSNPREGVVAGRGPKERQFRLRLHAEVFQHFQGVLLPLSQLYSKIIRIPRWYSRNIFNIATTAVKENNVVIVMDTNYLLQLVYKNLSSEHFYAYMKEQHPDTKAYNFATIVIPFTVLQEAYTTIWEGKNRFSLPVKTLLWSRVVAIVEQPHVYALSLAGEFPSTSLSIFPKLAYSKMSENVAGSFQHDPDLRILNVCVSLQHYLREIKIIENLGGVVPLEGITLFALLKYHVRRYCNTVKGYCVDRLLLCTMDRRMSQAAEQLGIRVFPNISDAPEAAARTSE